MKVIELCNQTDEQALMLVFDLAYKSEKGGVLAESAILHLKSKIKEIPAELMPSKEPSC